MSTTSTIESSIVRCLRELSKLSVLDHSLPDMLQRIVGLANDLVEGSCMAGLTLDVGGRVSTAAYTDDAVPEIDLAQNRSGGAGPCVDASRYGQVYVIPSTANDDRWKSFSASCVSHGVLSTLSAPVIPRSAKRAALNLYADDLGAFDAEDLALAEALANHAAVAIENAEAYFSAKQLAAQLQVALDTRIVIEQAKGLLMSPGRTAEDAFELLKRRSQRGNRKLRDVAADVVADAERRARSAEPPQPRTGRSRGPTPRTTPDVTVDR